MGRLRRPVASLVAAVVVGGGLVPVVALPGTAVPTSVTIAGSVQSEAGCPGDWQPDCTKTDLTFDIADDVWQGSVEVPGGDFEYKGALNHAWAANYGAHAVANGANISLKHAAAGSIKFYYDEKSHWVTDNVSSLIATVAGSFQSELGCPGDWQPDCLRSWLQDVDGDGTYTFGTAGIPAGSYEAKVAVKEAWDENYGKDGVRGGVNIPFTVPANGKVDFSYDSTSHLLTITITKRPVGPDNNVEWDGLRHDSRDTLYRTPGGAVPEGTPVSLRLRTFHDDVTGVGARIYSVNQSAQTILPMTRVAADVSCYQSGLQGTCDYWQVTLPNADPDSIWYRFVVTDGSKTVYYADDTAALDGGLGKPTDAEADNSWALSVYAASFKAPAWAEDAVIYQVFPDRYRNGSTRNDPPAGDVRYADPVKELTWGTLPEGYCRSYTGTTATTCPWRFGQPPDVANTDAEQPRGRDYQGGDLVGLDQKLDELKALGVNAVYLNPIFDAGSNHSYDTQDYTKVDPYFGTQKDFETLVRHASQKGIRLILDGVFNHMSSDSPFFDRYHHYATEGACESATSPYRSWFTFRKPTSTEPKNVCAPSTPGGDDTYYDGWFSFDSIPVLTKTDAALQRYFLTAPDSIAKRWLRAGTSGWRMDVMGDPSFPAGYWETFRDAVKSTKSDALIISETWQKDSTLLRMLQGDRADSTMNYRLRDAVVGFLTPGAFDDKGFPDSGRLISPTEFGNRIASTAEDYAPAALYSAMNLLDSHDTERLAWTLTPGGDTRADKEETAANVLAGKRSVQLASLLQFSMPGAPTIYYGDEVGLTGDDDPDDRRPYPWKDRNGAPDTVMQAHYTALAKIRRDVPALRSGDLRLLATNDAEGTVALGRASTTSAAITVVNRSDAARTLAVRVAGYLPDGTRLRPGYTVGGSAGSSTVADGVAELSVPARGAVIYVATEIDRRAPGAVHRVRVTQEGTAAASLSWRRVSGAVGYDVYTSPVTGGGYTKVNGMPVRGTSYTVTGLRTGHPVYVVVRAVDRPGNSSAASREVQALPHQTIGSSNVQRPPTLTHTISAVTRTNDVYGQVSVDGAANQPGATPTLQAQLGVGPDGSSPMGNDAWRWVDATFTTDAGNNEEFKASLLPESTGRFDYAYRYTTTAGRDWVYADRDGSSNGYTPTQAGDLSVNASSDTTAPGAPGGLRVTAASPADVSLTWGAVGGDAVAFYEVQRAPGTSGDFATIGSPSSTTFTDTGVSEGQSLRYRVVAVDTSFNRSTPSDVVTATAAPRKVSLTFTVRVPDSTDGTGRDVHIVGSLDRLDSGLPQWDPAGGTMAKVDATTWRIILTGMEYIPIEYKYALDDGKGDWTFAEKDSSCAEVSNRKLTVTYGTAGIQQVNDTVGNWRNVAPCGN